MIVSHCRLSATAKTAVEVEEEEDENENEEEEKEKEEKKKEEENEEEEKEEEEEEEDDPQEPTPWGINYAKGNLTPAGLQAFVDWAQVRLNLLLWRCQKPKAFAEFIEKLLEMESQLASGVEKLEEFHRVRGGRGGN